MKIPALRKAEYFSRTKTPVVVHRQPRQLPIRQHRHEFLELVIILSGEGIHVTGILRHRIQAGDVLVISRRRSHGYEATRGLNLVNILVSEDSLPRLARELRQLPGFHALFTLESVRWNQQDYASRLHLGASDLAQASEWADRLEAETLNPGPGTAVLAEAYLVLIMGLLARRYGTPARLASRPEGSMGSLLSWIEVHLAEPLSIPLLAKQAVMSQRTFHRRFTQATGSTPFEYLLNQRITRARELLSTHPGIRISEVAERCGFEDSNYFSRVFRRRSHLAPRIFARNSLKTISVNPSTI